MLNMHVQDYVPNMSTKYKIWYILKFLSKHLNFLGLYLTRLRLLKSYKKRFIFFNDLLRNNNLKMYVFILLFILLYLYLSVYNSSIWKLYMEFIKL